MDFAILGPLEVRDRGRPVAVLGAKQRTLLALLLLDANRVVSRDRLVEALWAGEPPGTATKALHVHVSQLRKTLASGGAPALIATRAPGYTIEIDPERLDLERFERLAREGRAARAAGAAERAAAVLRDALDLWRGPALADLADEPGLRPELERLEELRLAALEDRIEADLALGGHSELTAELEALAEANPLRERLRGQLMLALYRAGRQAEALATYQEARRALVDELGIEPSPTLQRLEKAILQQDPALEAAPRQAVAAHEPPPAPAPAGERKLATVLFADVVDSTGIGEHDPERAHAVMTRFFDAMAGEVELAGGTVEKFIGDAVMAAFGAPAAQEDHAERALHAALAMRSRLAELFGDALAVRIGVNTGDVVVGVARAGGSFVTGDAVNVAARLEQAAAPGEILVGERAADAVGDAFAFAEPATVEAKGKRAGVRCRALLRARAVTRSRGVSGLRRPFVGRARELELLRATYHRVAAGREPHLVTVVGDAGVGKTRLVQELWRLLEAEAPTPLRRVGRCLPYGRGITYAPLAEVLRAQLGLLETDSAEEVRRRLGAREILALTLGLEPRGDLHPLIARERLHDAWVDFIEEVAAERPAVFALEDVHWAEEPLLELAERVRRDVRAPLLLVATARPELLDERSSWSAGRNSSVLWLEPLESRDEEQLLGELLGAAPPPQLRELLHGRAEGNPFFLEEVLATLIDQGVLTRANGSWSMRELPRGFMVPDTIRAALAARIDLLPTAEKSALQAASVIGRVFWAGPLAELLGGTASDLRVLEERDFVRRRSASAFAGEREFAFKHALTREVAYATLTKAPRAHLHAAFAAWLERVGEGRDEDAPLLAHHYAEAVRPDDADLAWPDEQDRLEQLRESALRWLRRAAELAAGRYALDESLALYQRALELESHDAARVELWQAVARAHAVRYAKDHFREAMERAVTACAEKPLRAELMSELAFQIAFRWNHAEDRALVDEWVERTLDLAAPTSTARARALIARSYCRPGEAEDAAAEAARIAEQLSDPPLLSYAFRARADSALADGRFDDARAWAERRLELLGQLADPDHVADVYWGGIPGYLGRAHFDEARELARLHDEVTRELTPHHQLHGAAFLLEIEELAGDWKAIRALAPRAEAAVEANAATPCVHNPRSLLVVALASAYLGDEREARRLEELAESLGVDAHGRVYDVRMRLALHRGDLNGAAQLLRESETPQTSLIRSTKFAPVATRLDVLAALGRREDVERETVPLLRPDTYLEPFALRALAIVRRDEALLAQAVERFERLGLRWHARQTRGPAGS